MSQSTFAGSSMSEEVQKSARNPRAEVDAEKDVRPTTSGLESLLDGRREDAKKDN